MGALKVTWLDPLQRIGRGGNRLTDLILCMHRGDEESQSGTFFLDSWVKNGQHINAPFVQFV